MIGEVKARFSKVETLKPGGFFIHYDLHKVQSLEVSLVQMDALSLNYWLNYSPGTSVTRILLPPPFALSRRYP